MGHGTKIIFTGDPYQIDNPYVDSTSNGFNYIVSKFRHQSISAHIELQKGAVTGRQFALGAAGSRWFRLWPGVDLLIAQPGHLANAAFCPGRSGAV